MNYFTIANVKYTLYNNVFDFSSWNCREACVQNFEI